MKQRLYLEGTVIGLVLSGFFYLWPAGYRLSAEYSTSGLLTSGDVASRTVEKEIVRLSSLQTVRCSYIDAGQQIRCTLALRSRREVKRVTEILTNVLPATFGWIASHDLESRVRDTQIHLQSLESRLAILDAEFGSLLSAAPDLDRQIEEKTAERDRIAAELDSRKRQAELVTEALQKGTTGDDRTLFDQKRMELEVLLADLQQQWLARSEELARLAEGKKRRETVENQLTQLRVELGLTQTKLQAWMSLQQASPGPNGYANPETFRLISRTDGVMSQADRRLFRALGGFLIGLLLFFGVRWRTFRQMSLEVFLTADEVVQETGLALLGVIPHTEAPTRTFRPEWIWDRLRARWRSLPFLRR